MKLRCHEGGCMRLTACLPGRSTPGSTLLPSLNLKQARKACNLQGFLLSQAKSYTAHSSYVLSATISSTSVKLILHSLEEGAEVKLSSAVHAPAIAFKELSGFW